MRNYTIKEDKLKALDERIEQYTAYISAFAGMVQNLENYKGKVINKTFFDQFYMEKTENGTFENAYIRGKEWEWSSVPFTLYIRNDRKTARVELKSRDRLEMIEAVKAESEKNARWLKEAQDEREKVENMDVEKVIEDLIAFRNASGVSDDIWREIIELFPVKYFDSK